LRYETRLYTVQRYEKVAQLIDEFVNVYIVFTTKIQPSYMELKERMVNHATVNR